MSDTAASVTASAGNLKEDKKRVGLFVTCLADLYRPSVAFAAIQLLEQAGCTVEVPEAQTCCGQPAFNNGDRNLARALAKQVLQTFQKYDWVVIPSGSCGGMIKKHVPELLSDDPVLRKAALELSAKTFELTDFLVTICQKTDFGATLNGKAVYHNSCSSLRELQIKEQPGVLLAGVKNLQQVNFNESEVCCGFGGTFSVSYPEISTKMADKKANNISAAGPDFLISGDLGCLMNINGRLKRQGSPIKAFHIAEVLAGMTDNSAPLNAEPLLKPAGKKA